MVSRARALWRAARDSALLGAVLAAVDRLWWRRTIRRAGIVDLDHVALQLGRRVSAGAAVRRYVGGGFREGFSLNPLMMERTISRQLSDADRVPALYAYLVNDRTRLAVSPNWDAPAVAAAHPESLADPAGPLGFVWRRAQEDGWVELGAAGAAARVPWAELLRALSRPPRLGPAAEPAAASFVCVLGPSEQDPDEALALASRAAVRHGMTVDLVLVGDSPDVARQAAIMSLWAPGIAVRRAPADEVLPPVAPRPGTTVFRGQGAELAPEGFDALLEAGAGEPVAALWLTLDGTIASAGTVYRSGRGSALLAGFPADDARRAGTSLPVPRLAGPALAWPGGASPLEPGRTLTDVYVVAAASPSTTGAAADPAGTPPADTDVDALLAAAGLRVAAADGEPALERSVPPDGSPAGMRWAIKTAAPAGRAGRSWGDTHFARGIADALGRLGQQVVVDGFGARDRATAVLDDVTLVLRGPERIRPPRHGRRILWIISHPDQITEDELNDFDVVFAASVPWARTAAARFGRPITPLLQCTDVTRFHPTGAQRTDEIVFVGTARGIARPVVVEPIRAGIPVRVYGPDWRGYIPASAIAATGIANERLAALYESAGVVLNDHWPAMRREGFVSNRLYDVVAAGGRAISDDVEGIEELFGGAVRTFRTTEDLLDLFRGPLDDRFPSADELAAIGRRVRERDSFDARAASLLDAARTDA